MTSSQHLPKAAIILAPYGRNLLYPDSVMAQIRRICDVRLDIPTTELPQVSDAELSEIELLFSGWDGPALTDALLRRMPALRAVFYAAGSIHPIVTEAFWQRNIPICAVPQLNAIPVAEFTFAQIILCLKQSHYFARITRESKEFWSDERITAPLGTYQACVGLVSLGEIGRRVLERLRTLDVSVQVFDPFLSAEKAAALGVTLTDLQALFQTSDVVSLHTPLLEETKGFISEPLIASLRHGAAFINTARGALVDEPGLCRVLARRPDIQAVIDVTANEPPAADSPLYTLPNVYLTPHIAGALGRDCMRMGDAITQEAERFITKQKLQYRIRDEQIKHTA